MSRSAGLAMALAVILTAAPLAAQPPPLWGGLKPGRHAVGYRRAPLREGTLHVWYPAAAGPSERLGFEAYVSSPAALPARILRAPTAARRDPAAAPGRFPLVLYAGDPGQAEPDNTVLSEYLASHGYVVVAAFGVPQGLEAALGAVSGLAFVNRDTIAVIARAGGWSAAVEFAAPRPAVRAVIGFDPPNDPPALAAPSRPVLRFRSDAMGRRSHGESAPPGADGITITIPRSTTHSFTDRPAHLDLLDRPNDAGPDHRRLIGSITHAFLDGALRAWWPSLMELAAHLSRAGLGVSSRFPGP